MRPLKSHFPEHALQTLETVLKQTQEARVFRRAQAVREVVAGHHVHTVSATFHLANSALRKWVQRFAQEGPQGLGDRPRSGRPPKVTCELEQHLQRLVEQDPCNTVPALRSGIVANLRLFCPNRPGSHSAVRASAAR